MISLLRNATYVDEGRAESAFVAEFGSAPRMHTCADRWSNNMRDMRERRESVKGENKRGRGRKRRIRPRRIIQRDGPLKITLGFLALLFNGLCR